MDGQTTGRDENIAASTSAATTTMTLERRVIDGRERAVVRDTVEVPYDANDL